MVAATPTELLQYQVDHRLQGAVRAQVAARLAVIYLMNRKPEKALATLRSSRNSDVANALRNQRLLIEARALSDTGRHDLAIEIVSSFDGREAVRVRRSCRTEAQNGARKCADAPTGG
jgi:hypothetical protein